MKYELQLLIICNKIISLRLTLQYMPVMQVGSYLTAVENTKSLVKIIDNNMHLNGIYIIISLGKLIIIFN